jgi:hypothetical protein
MVGFVPIPVARCNTQALEQNANKVKDYCRLNLGVTVIKAVEPTLGVGK